MNFPVNFMHFNNYALANIPTKLMYKHRVDHYDYTTVLHCTCIHTYNKIHIETVSRIGNRTLIGRGVHVSGKRTSEKVHASGK